MSKARDLADSAQEINILDGKSFLDEDNLASDSATGIASQQSIKAYVDGITTTNITSTGALNSGSITSGFGNIDNGSSTITTTGAITGGSFVIGSADINENDLESIDGITAGTVAASKAVVVNANKDITGFRNLTATGTINGTLSGAIASTTTATTQAESDDSTKVATTAYVVDKITTLIGGAPSTLNDLNELAAAINDDANYNSTLTTALATKLPLAGGTMTGDVLYNDSVKAKFGAGSDLQIYHDGLHSYVRDEGTGGLILSTNGAAVYIQKGDTETSAEFNIDGAVKLRYDNAQKFATTSTGISVTGTVTSDGLSLGDYADALTIGDSNDLSLYHSGGSSTIKSNTGQLIIRTDALRVLNQANSEQILHGDANGAVSLYYDNAVRLATTSSGVSVTGNVAVSGTVDGRDVATDGSKLDGVASSANNYSHPTGNGNNHIPSGGSTDQILKYASAGTAQWADPSGGSMVLLNRSDVASSSQYVFTGFDSTKYDAYVIDFHGIQIASGGSPWVMYFSSNGGSSYMSNLKSVVNKAKYASNNSTSSDTWSNGYMEIAGSIGGTGDSQGSCGSGTVKLMNVAVGNDRGFQAHGAAAYINYSTQRVIANSALMADQSGNTSQPDCNAIKMKFYNGTNINKGTISVFGIVKA